jgi:hypothetical protein
MRWTELEQKVQQILQEPAEEAPPKRPPEDMLEVILATVRSIRAEPPGPRIVAPRPVGAITGQAIYIEVLNQLGLVAFKPLLPEGATTEFLPGPYGPILRVTSPVSVPPDVRATLRTALNEVGGDLEVVLPVEIKVHEDVRASDKPRVGEP